jgi:hypothetical protein
VTTALSENKQPIPFDHYHSGGCLQAVMGAAASRLCIVQVLKGQVAKLKMLRELSRICSKIVILKVAILNLSVLKHSTF